MARTMSTAAVGRVNRRFLLLALILAVISGVLAYAAFSNSGGGGSSAVEIGVVVAVDVIPAGETITAELLEERQLAATAVGENPLTNIEDAAGRVALEQIAPGEPILSSSLVGSTGITSNDNLGYIIASGKRGMAITTSAVINAGGLVLPGDHVDVYWAPTDPLDSTPVLLLAENVEVLAVAQVIEDIPPTAPGVTQDGEPQTGGATNGDRPARATDAEANLDAITVTLLLTTDQGLRTLCGEVTGSLRLAVRAYGDNSPSGSPEAPCVIAGKDEQQQVQP